MKVELKDKVFDIRYGWGEVTKVNKKGDFPVAVTFKNNFTFYYTRDGKTRESNLVPFLSFFEYNLEDGGFCQVRTPAKYERVLVRDREDECWQIDLFLLYKNKLEHPFHCVQDKYRQCIPYEGNEELLNTSKNPNI